MVSRLTSRAEAAIPTRITATITTWAKVACRLSQVAGRARAWLPPWAQLQASSPPSQKMRAGAEMAASRSLSLPPIALKNVVSTGPPNPP